MVVCIVQFINTVSVLTSQRCTLFLSYLSLAVPVQYQPSSLLLCACVMCCLDVFVAVSFRLNSQCTVCCYTFSLFFSLGCCCHSCCLYCWQTWLVLLLLPLTVQFHAFAHRYHIQHIYLCSVIAFGCCVRSCCCCSSTYSLRELWNFDTRHEIISQTISTLLTQSNCFNALLLHLQQQLEIQSTVQQLGFCYFYFFICLAVFLILIKHPQKKPKPTDRQNLKRLAKGLLKIHSF